MEIERLLAVPSYNSDEIFRTRLSHCRRIAFHSYEGIRQKVGLLEARHKPEDILARRTDGVTGKESAEVYEFKGVTQVRDVGLEA